MRRIAAALILLCALLAPFHAARAAQAEPAGIRLAFSTSPRNVYEPGSVDVIVTITIENGTASDYVEPLFLSLNGTYAKNISGRIIGGSERSITIEDVNIQEEDFGRDLSCTLVYVDFTGAVRTYEDFAVIKKSAPELTFERRATPEKVLVGDKVLFSYRIVNTTSIAFTDIRAQDAPFGVVAQVDRLLPGEEVTVDKELVFRAPVDSAPALTYARADSGEALSKTLKNLRVEAAQTGLEVTLRADTQSVEPGGEFALICHVRNASGEQMQNLSVRFDVLNAAYEIPVLPSGGSYLIRMAVFPIADRDYTAAVTAKAAGGRPVADWSNTERVLVAGDENVDSAVLMAYASGVSTGVSVQAQPNIKNLSAPGDVVSFEILIKNGAGKLTNASLREKSLGEIERMDTLAEGDKRIVYSISVARTTRYEFSFEAQNASGVPVYVQADPVTVQVADAPAQKPGLGVSSAPGGNVIVAANSATYASGQPSYAVPLLTALLGVVTLICLSLVILLSLYIREKYIKNP